MPIRPPPYLTSGLAELYAKTGRIRDAVIEAQDIIKRNPNNLEARRLLGRIYLRSLGDMQAGSGSESVLKLAIEQYEQIIRLQPDSMDDHLLLGRLYRLNNDLQKAESEFKTAVKLATRFRRSRHHPGLSLQRTRRHRARGAGSQLGSESGALGQALFRARLHLRAAKTIQRSHRRLPPRD